MEIEQKTEKQEHQASECQEEIQKIRAEHLYKNMNDLLKEIRLLDKSSLLFSGVIWAWIIRYGDNSSFIYYLIPVVVSSLLFYKTTTLLSEYDSQKKKYYKMVAISKKKKKCSSKDKKRTNLNFRFHSAIVVFNIITAICLIYANSDYKIVLVKQDTNKTKNIIKDAK